MSQSRYCASDRGGGTVRELIDGRWPLWMRPADPNTDPSGYGGIAAYVVPGILAELSFRPVNRVLLESQTGLYGADLDKRIVEGIWAGLVDRQVVYDDPPWHPGDGQRIRDPEWLLRRTDQGAGTCIDLSLLFAGACLNEGLDTYLLMLSGERKAHVAVAIRLGAPPAKDADEISDRLMGDAARPAGVAKPKADGVLAIEYRDVLAEAAEDEGLLLIDVTAATRGEPDTSLGEAQRRAWAALAGPDYQTLAHLVDIALRQYGCGDEELPRPTRRGALRTLIAPPAQEPVPFRAHETARAVFADAAGKYVIRGAQGVGKSTLARVVAAMVDNGYGWFLPAASRVAFDTALAEAELAERGEPARELEGVEREGLARDALNRLGRIADSWVIVLDNANEGAAPFEAARAAIDRLPEPRPGQLIIATSTAGEDRWPGWTVVDLPVVSPGELAEHGDDLAARLSAGRPLLMSAFTRLLAADADARLALPNGHLPGDGPPEGDEAARRAAELYWTAARESLERRAGDGTGPDGAAVIACAERLAWLPPDRIEPAATGAGPEVTDVLVSHGLLAQSATPGAYALHRLFGEAVRNAVGWRAEQTVQALLADPGARRSLLRHGDADVSQQLEAALGQTSDGVALWALGAIQEVYQAKASAGTFARAAERLDEADPEQARALADCLHAAGRVVQHKPKDASSPEEVAGAIDGMYRAIGLRPRDDVVEIAKHLALLALLRQRAARYLTDPAAKLAELREVMQAYEDSWLRRRDVLGDADPLVDRAYYNRAGVRVTLAQEDPANAAEYLQEAERVYRATAAFRKRYYNGPNPITAAAVHGIGIVGFYGVLFGLVNQPDAVLEEAINAANEALVMRRQTSIPGDIGKSAGLLLKLAALQAVFTSAREAPGSPAGRDLSTGKVPAELGEVARELDMRAQFLGQLGMTPGRLRAAGVTDEQIQALGLEPPTPE
jgi:hypothetical protein